MKESDNPTERGDRRRANLFADADEVVAFAQAYYATEFPNRRRGDCLDAETVRSMARSGALPDADFRAHLFGCSECFRAYRGARLSGRTSALGRASGWRASSGALWNLFQRPVYLAAGAACLLIVATVAAAVWVARGHGEGLALNNKLLETVPVEIERGGTAETNGAVVTTEADRPPIPKVTGPPNRKSVARASTRRLPHAPTFRVVEINLRDDILLRDGENTGGEPHVISLPPRRQKLRLRLTEGSGGGRFVVSIVDAFGRPLVKVAARSDGKTLVTSLDVRGIPAKGCRLCIARLGEAPDCYQITIVK